MRRAIWGLAILLDVLGIVMGLAYFLGEPPPGVWLWGSAQVLLFGALLVLLAWPRVIPNPAHSARVTWILCFSLPVAVSLNSLDNFIFSSQEWLAIFIAAVVASLNWAGFRASSTHPTPRAA